MTTKELKPVSAKQWLTRIIADAPIEQLRILNVCGGHERTISFAGIRSILPTSIEIIPDFVIALIHFNGM